MSRSTLCLAALALALPASGCGPAPGWEEVAAPGYEPPGRTIAVEEAPEVAAPRPKVRRALEGRWVGEGCQSDGPSWRVELDIARSDEGPCAVVRYPDEDCAGYWTCTEVGGRRLIAVEHITEGADRCAPRVDVGVELDRDGELIFRAVAGDITAGARLQRAR